MSRTSRVLLLSGDYAERLSALYEAALEAAEHEASESASGARRIGEQSAYTTLRAEHDALREEAERAGTVVVLKALGRKEWRAIKDKHPPRDAAEHGEDVAKADRLAGVNTESVEDDLVYASLVEPEFSSRAAFDEWVDDLSEGEFTTIVNRAWALTNVAMVDPKSLPASLTRSSGES